MKSFTCIILFSLALAIVAGCASTQFTEQTPPVNEIIARPNQIWVYNFAATSSEIPADSPIKGEVGAPSTPPTAEQLETGRQLGALIAQNLATDIQAMGLSAVQAGPDSSPQVGDAVIRGYIVSVEDGGVVKRFVIGFGYGTSEMDTVVEGYVMTPEGLRRLGSGTLSSSGSKTPGMVLPAAMAIATGNPIGLVVGGGIRIYREASGKNSLDGRAKATADEIARQLKIRFQERGWINVQPPETEVSWKSVGSGVGAAASNVLYVPAKLVYGTLGGIAGGAGYALTGGDKRVADTIWRSSLGGDYVVTPDMITGNQPVHFSGPTSMPPAATSEIGTPLAINGSVPDSNTASNILPASGSAPGTDN
ncbi:MAG: DUF4410 domain-containing protein [Deltaproteobacteria bacterium]|nr:DUF4410 domain-containing protein [Deltaproteobacteria bacterium]